MLQQNCYRLLVAVIIFVMCSCGEVAVHEKNTNIASYNWFKKDTAAGQFSITDTLSSYNVYLVLRHLDKFQYNNIWLNIGLQSPRDTMYYQKVNLSLGNDANGWEGSGMNDIWEVRKLISGQPRRFKKNGLYTYKVTHIMRDEPLFGIMSVGIRVEKMAQTP